VEILAITVSGHVMITRCPGYARVELVGV